MSMTSTWQLSHAGCPNWSHRRAGSRIPRDPAARCRFNSRQCLPRRDLKQSRCLVRLESSSPAQNSNGQTVPEEAEPLDRSGDEEARPALSNAQKERLAKSFSKENDNLKALAKKVNKALRGNSIYLVGMMGSGKSTVSKLLAEALGYFSADTDELCEIAAKQTVSEIFAEDGEEAFRELETAVLKELMAHTSVVVSTGGGAVVKRLNWGYMQHAVVVWLHGSPELLARRALQDASGSRPLLSLTTDAENLSESERFDQTKAKLDAILKDREGKYAQADIKVSLEGSKSGSTGANAAVVTERVLQAIKARIEGDRRQTPSQQQFKGFGKPTNSVKSG